MLREIMVLFKQTWTKKVWQKLENKLSVFFLFFFPSLLWMM